jgi:6-phosphogluconolactonase
LLSASYFEGHVDIHRLDEQGIPTTLVGTNYEGRDKAHSIRTTRDNRFAYVPYVKDRNALYQYAFDEKSGKLLALDPPQAKLPTGIGPRHVAYHPTEPFVYFSNEQHLGAIAYRIQRGGTLQLLQVCQPGDLKPAEGLAASDILITPDGRFLYVGVRDFDKGLVDAIHRYAVSPDGTLTHLGQTKSAAIPWGLQLSPDGRHLLVTATNGGTLTAFEITTDGDLAKRTSIGWGKMIRAIAVVEVK